MSVNTLIKLAQVSKSGYYSYLKETEPKKLKAYEDEIDFEWIYKAYRFKNRPKGAKMIKMTLLDQYKIIMNLKKIRRLMKMFNLTCPIRKANPYKRMARAIQTSHIALNLLERQFKDGAPGQILLTDITYLIYDLNKRAYLSVIKDAVTNEIIAYKISKSLDIKFVEETIEQLNQIRLHENALINSDQGCHYTSNAFQKALKTLGLQQSMSRRGNCWDNAPIESFFGHMKDEFNLIDCKTIREVENEINDYMDYYNNYRYQWDLERMTPKTYDDKLRNKYKKNDCSIMKQPSLQVFN